MADTHLANHRGTITGLAASGSRVLYVTKHREGQSTALHVFDFQSGKSSQSTLPAGATALRLIDKTAFVASTDGTIYKVLPGKRPSSFGAASDVTALEPTHDGIAIAAGSRLILNDESGGEIAEWDLGEPISALAASPDGKWLTAGTRRGKIAVFAFDQNWTEAQSERLHDGEVTALRFAPDELRVYSAGTDARVLISYVRGSFDTEDRGGTNSHERPVRDLIIGNEFATEDGKKRRFYTVSDDSSVKSWPLGRGGSQRPSTHAEGVVKSTHAAIVSIDDATYLAVAGTDSTIRLFAFDSDGKVETRHATVRDAYAHAETMLGDSSAKQRQRGYEALSTYSDARSVALITEYARDYETDHKLRVKAVTLLGGVDHADVADALETFFDADASDVRIAAMNGLLNIRGADDRDTLDRAIETEWEDLGLRAVKAAVESGSDEAKDLLKSALDNDNENVRNAALSALEHLFGTDPQGTLYGLESVHESMRRLALVRLYERKVLDTARVAARIRRTWDDDEYRVRHTAFHVAALRRPKLVAHLRAGDPQFHRQIFEIEHFKKTEKERPKEVPAARAARGSLAEEDLHPILEAAASRDLEVSLLGARALAVVGDERSLGTLLQLSREPQAHARANAAIALQALRDPRAINRIRMMLHDGEQQVRDAAFSALESLQTDRPLSTVSAGLSAPNVDTRERALSLLAKTLKASNGAPKGNFAGRELLLRALNDAASSLRLEAFKNVLNLEVEGGGTNTLRFITQSHHSDVRRQCLEETQAHPKDADYKEFLLELLNDPDSGIYADAFEFGRDRWPSTEHARLYEAITAAKTAEARIFGIEKLANERDAALRALLAKPLVDETPAVRLAAVAGLVRADMRDVLTTALENPFEDVRVEAASALASMGDERALDGLLAIVKDYRERVVAGSTVEELQTREARVISALSGIRDLGHARALSAVVALIDVAKSSPVVEAAASALPWLVRPQTLDDVRDLVRSDSPVVAQQTALALAYHGDPTVDSLIFGKLGTDRELIAAFALRKSSPDRFLAYVDGNGQSAKHALSLVLLLELSEHDGVPEKCVSLLSANDARVRLKAGEAIEHYDEQPRFYRWVYETVNELANPAGDHDVPAKTLLALSRAISHGTPLVAVRAAQLVGSLQHSDSQNFETGWDVFSSRLEDELKRLERLANQPKKPESEQGRLASAWRSVSEKLSNLVTNADTFEEALASLSFGAYVGLTRETGAPDAHTVRSAAIGGLLRLAEAHPGYKGDVRNILLLGLGDPAQNVRQRAFDGLLSLDVSHDVISTEALSTGHSDMGFRGLELLAGSGGGNELLEKTLLESTNGLEREAAKLLIDRIGEVAVHKLGLVAASESFRRQAVQGLARQFSNDDAADALRRATTSRFDDVRRSATHELASRKDSAAFEPLTELSKTKDSTEQYEVANSFKRLADARAAQVLLDRLEENNELEGASYYFDAIVDTGGAEAAERLLGWVDGDVLRGSAANAALRLSGYTQYEWMDDEEVTAEWVEQMDPVYPTVFANLFDLAYRIADADILGEMVGYAKWPEPNSGLDSTLASLLSFAADENVRHRAVEIVGWRLSHRNGPADALVDVVGGGDPLDQFYAAEGLALAGRGEGLAVLRTAADAMPDLNIRERAILAMGKLADPSVLDYLLELADNDGEYLQSAAAEAIGHMSESERAGEVFAILKRLAMNDTTARTAAFKGLRWFGTPAAWEVLRTQARADYWWVADEAVKLLRHDNDSRDLLSEILRTTDDWDIANSAAEGLRHIHGPDSLEPDYLIVQAEQTDFDASEETLERLRERGDVQRILEVLPEIQPANKQAYYEPLVGALLSKTPLPVAEAAEMIDSKNGGIASVAARILGRAGADAASYGAALVKAVNDAHSDWNSAWAETLANRRGARERLDDVTLRYRWLVWACGQVEVGAEAVASAAKLPDHAAAWPIRESALATLGERWIGEVGVEALVELATTGDPKTRAMASTELERVAPEKAAALLPEAFDDDVRVGRLTSSLPDEATRGPLRRAILDPSTAQVALPRLAALGDTEALVEAMSNKKLDDLVRQGAIDALGTIVNPEVPDLLAKFGADEAQDEMLRKAAWRARRRVARRL